MKRVSGLCEDGPVETANTPKLAPPGAGLPWLESLYVRWWVGPVLSRRQDKDENLRAFRMLGGRLSREADAVPDGRLDSRVLVPRMRGIEDSSRLWSANETLEHVMLTGRVMAELIAALAEGRGSPREVRIEDFKPKGVYAGRDARPDLRAFVGDTLALLEPLPIVDGGAAHRHPWLGELNALQWTWLLAGHTSIHLAQLVAIKRGLD